LTVVLLENNDNVVLLENNDNFVANYFTRLWTDATESFEHHAYWKWKCTTLLL